MPSAALALFYSSKVLAAFSNGVNPGYACVAVIAALHGTMSNSQLGIGPGKDLAFDARLHMGKIIRWCDGFLGFGWFNSGFTSSLHLPIHATTWSGALTRGDPQLF